MGYNQPQSDTIMPESTTQFFRGRPFMFLLSSKNIYKTTATASSSIITCEIYIIAEMSNASIWRRLASSLCCSSGSALIHTCHPRCHLHIAGISDMMSVILTPVSFQRRARIAVLQCLHVTIPSNSAYCMSRSPCILQVIDAQKPKLILASHITHCHCVHSIVRMHTCRCTASTSLRT